jgi:F0F1-type ATP synthase delta subunit
MTLQIAYEIAEKHNIVNMLDDFLSESPGMTEDEILEEFFEHYQIDLEESK